MQKYVDYYLFLISPWSYLAIKRVDEIFRRHDVRVNYKPIDVGQTYSKMEGVPLAKRHPSRLALRLTELKRWSSFVEMPINLQPSFFPADQTLAARMLVALEDSEQAGTFASAVLSAVWRDELNISDESTIKSIASRCDLDSDDLLHQATTELIAQRYQSFTDEAHNRGVFGSPSFIFNEELFWGQDRLDFLDRALANG